MHLGLRDFAAERTRTNERGSTTVLFTFISFFVLLPVIGLAIDGSIVFWEKARLSASIDAATLAAGRSLNLGVSPAAAVTESQEVGNSYLAANFQPGSMGTTLSQDSKVTVNPPAGASGYWVVNGIAKATVPLYFMRILGFAQTQVAAVASATRRNVNVILILDRSYSLALSGSCSSLISSAQQFTNMFVVGDDLGLVTFQTTASVDYPHGTDFKTRPAPGFPNALGMSQLISHLQCSGYTNTAMAFNLAHSEIHNNSNSQGSLNVIVFFSDGKPDAITASFPGKSYQDSRDSVSPNWNAATAPISTCSPTGPGVLVALDENPDPIGYTLGLVDPYKPQLIDSPNPPNSPGDLIPQSSRLLQTSSCSYGTTTYNGKLNFPYIYSSSTSSAAGGPFNVRLDIGYIPARDSYNNSTKTGYRPASSANPNDPNLLFTSANGSPSQIGFLRPDTPMGIVNAALNTSYGEVSKFGNDNIITYAIGLGNYVDDGFMKDIANTSDAPHPDSTRPVGQYVYAPTSSQLSSAFRQIASQILRIAQ